MLSSPEFVREQTVAANVVRLARERLTEILGTLAGHPDEDVPAATAVHDARRGLKRLRALLRLARTGLGEDTFARENTAARDTGRELSAVRDAQVLVSAFDALQHALAGRVATETPAAVMARLRAGVDTAVDALRSQDRHPRAVALLTAARERLDTWSWHGVEDDWSTLGEGLQKTYRAARRASAGRPRTARKETFTNGASRSNTSVSRSRCCARYARRLPPRPPRRSVNWPTRSATNTISPCWRRRWQGSTTGRFRRSIYT